MTVTAFDEHVPQQDLYWLSDSDTDAWTGILTGDGRGSRYDALTVSSDDTIDHTLEFKIDAGGAPIYLGSVVVPAGAGQDGVPAVDALAALQVGSTAGILLLGGIAFSWRVTVALSADKHITMLAVGGMF